MHFRVLLEQLNSGSQCLRAWFVFWGLISNLLAVLFCDEVSLDVPRPVLLFASFTLTVFSNVSELSRAEVSAADLIPLSIIYS